MKRLFNASLVLFLAAGLVAGCASSKKATQHPLVGMWDYTVETPDGTYNGVVSIAEAEGALLGTITNDALPGKMELTGLMFEDSKVTFNFDSGEFGVLEFNADITDNLIKGNINVPGFGEMPVVGSKKTPDDM